ncbi:MAG: hypothetical protein DBY25_00700 [Clostridiales bacterium]|nr:MAG: hypothetical protein DBY25_00700 [Clostridiales bacterium]
MDGSFYYFPGFFHRRNPCREQGGGFCGMAVKRRAGAGKAKRRCVGEITRPADDGSGSRKAVVYININQQKGGP